MLDSSWVEKRKTMALSLYLSNSESGAHRSGTEDRTKSCSDTIMQFIASGGSGTGFVGAERTCGVDCGM